MTIEELKIEFGKILAFNKINPNTKRGKEIIWALYTGHYVGAETLPPYILICLMSGRHDELVTMPE